MSWVEGSWESSAPGEVIAGSSSPPSGGSSYEERETLALASKNCFQNLEPSQTAEECWAYCSTTGRMLVVTIRWARLKLWSISGFTISYDFSHFLGETSPGA